MQKSIEPLLKERDRLTGDTSANETAEDPSLGTADIALRLRQGDRRPCRRPLQRDRQDTVVRRRERLDDAERRGSLQAPFLLQAGRAARHRDC